MYLSRAAARDVLQLEVATAELGGQDPALASSEGQLRLATGGLEHVRGCGLACGMILCQPLTEGLLDSHEIVSRKWCLQNECDDFIARQRDSPVLRQRSSACVIPLSFSSGVATSAFAAASGTDWAMRPPPVSNSTSRVRAPSRSPESTTVRMRTSSPSTTALPPRSSCPRIS
jgi:hypothetical protein